MDNNICIMIAGGLISQRASQLKDHESVKLLVKCSDYDLKSFFSMDYHFKKF
jgi:hypothetical protein